jgi:chitin-binding protein
MPRRNSKAISRASRSSLPEDKSGQARHGHIFTPPSRAYLAWKAGQIDDGALNQREGGKFFPATQGGLIDPIAPDDSANVPPPADGQIASAGQATGRFLDDPGDHWQKHDVYAGEVLDISWHFNANHKTRRFNYFITRENWNPQQVLTRASFEDKPFYQVEFAHNPHWAHNAELTPPNPTYHALKLPALRGYHVLLAVWEVCDTSMAFYQVVDLNFLAPVGGGAPSTPTGLVASAVTTDMIELSWNASHGAVSYYRIDINGTMSVDVSAPTLSQSFYGLKPEETFVFMISAWDENGNASAPSSPITVTTRSEGSEDGPPGNPINLHTMSVEARSLTLMWGQSPTTVPVDHYKVFRGGQEVARVPGGTMTFTDSGLTPATQYDYMVHAYSASGKGSSSTNPLIVSTAPDEGGSQYPAWKLNTLYQTGEIVSHGGSNWSCLQGHTSYTTDWAPGAAPTLWVPYQGTRRTC